MTKLKFYFLKTMSLYCSQCNFSNSSLLRGGVYHLGWRVQHLRGVVRILRHHVWILQGWSRRWGRAWVTHWRSWGWSRTMISLGWHVRIHAVDLTCRTCWTTQAWRTRHIVPRLHGVSWHADWVARYRNWGGRHSGHEANHGVGRILHARHLPHESMVKGECVHKLVT